MTGKKLSRNKILVSEKKALLYLTIYYNNSIGGKMQAKKVYQYSNDGLFLQEFKSISAAKEFIRKSLGIKDGSSIQSCLSGKINYGYGFMWSYEKLERIPVKKSKEEKKKKVYQYDIYGNFIAEYNSLNEANLAIYGKKGTVKYLDKKTSLSNGFQLRSEKFDKIEPYIRKS